MGVGALGPVGLPALAGTMRSKAPQLTTPKDFRRFWRDTLEELRGTEARIEAEPFQRTPYARLQGQKLRFRSLGDAKLSGYALGWRDERPRPLVIHSHGYGGRSIVQWLWALSGLNVVGFDVRGFGESFSAAAETSNWGYMLTGIQEPREYVLRGAVCDYLRAGQVAAELFQARTSLTVFHGFSFSAALALMAEAVTQTADLLAAGVPTFGWHEGRLGLVKNGTAVEVRRFLEARPSERSRVMGTLSYFDSMNFAPLIECPTLVGYGRRDVVVPPETVLAITKHLSCPREILELPVSHTDEPAEAAWEYFDATWMEMALDGVPEDFGASSQIRAIGFPAN